MKIGILASPAKQSAWMNKQTPAELFSWVQDSEAHENFDVFVDLDFDTHTQNAFIIMQKIPKPYFSWGQ